jgi:hypothetical protein
MRKDIFIDTNIASRFSNPMDKEYKKLVQWLMKNDISAPNFEEDAWLVLSKKLEHEYNRSNQHPNSLTAIPMIIFKLQREERINFISNSQIKDFKASHFSKKVERKLLSNKEDREHIPVVLLSDRKFVLTIDDNFTKDLKDFSGFEVTISNRPEEIPYE